MSIIADMASFLALLLQDGVYEEYSVYIFSIVSMASWSVDDIKAVCEDSRIAKTLGVLTDEIVYKSLCTVIALKEGKDRIDSFKTACEVLKPYSFKIDPSNKIGNKQVLDVFKSASGIIKQKQSEVKTENVEETPVENKKEISEVKDEHVEQKDRLEVVRETWRDDVEGVVDGLMRVYRSLYESCYDVGKPAGILVKDGILRTKTDGSITTYGDVVINKKLFLAISRLLNTFGYDRYIAKGGQVVKEPDIKDLIASKGPVTLYGMHLQFMFGHIRYCRGLQSYLKKCTSGFNSDRVTNWSTMEGYVKSQLESYIYKALADSGLGSDIDERSLDIERQVLECLSLSLKNIIVVCDSTKGQNTEVRICAGQQIKDVNGFLRSLEKQLNPGNTVTTKVKQVGRYENGILDVNIIYNEQRYMDASLYAHEVLDSLIDQGIKPSWSKVIMGKGLDGKTYYHNFRNEKAPVYCLYASSRSGKGVMTLNLLASALADGCKVMYTDAKPDTANIMAEIAWRAGKEAAIINGVTADSKDLECLLGSPRGEFSYRGINEISRLVFSEKEQLRQFYRLTQYYRSLELVGEIAAKRKEQDIAKTGSAKDWMVCVFDEIQNLSEVEIQLRSQMKDIKAELQRQIKEESKGKDPSPDPEKIKAVEFIKSYDEWIKNIYVKWQTGKTINFGKANMTIIFIWQTSNFPFNDQKKDSLSGLSQIVKSFGTATKMIGRAAIAGGGLTAYGNTQSLSKMSWYDEKFSGEKGGFFAICSASLTEDRATVIRPYNIYGDDKGKDLIISAAAVNGFKPDDLLGSSLYKDDKGDYQVIHEVGFEGYAQKLLGKFGLDTATQINLAFEYVDEFTRAATDGQAGFLDYMYSSHIGLSSYKESDELEQLSESSEPVEVSDQALGLGGTAEEIEEPSNDSNTENDSETAGTNELDLNDNRFIPDEVLKKSEEAKQKALEDSKQADEEIKKKLEDLMKQSEVVQEQIRQNSEKDIDDEKSALERYQKLAEKQDEAMYGKPVPFSQIVRVNMLANDKQSYKNKNGKAVYINGRSIDKKTCEIANSGNTIRSTFTFAKKNINRIINGMKGPKQEMSAIFRELVNNIAGNGFNLGLAKSLTLVNGNMYINGRCVDTGNVINFDDANLTVCDVADYKIIKRYFKSLEELVVDNVAFSSLEITSGTFKQDQQVSIDFMFTGLKVLQRMVIIDVSGKQHVINRKRTSKDNFSDISDKANISNRMQVASMGRMNNVNINHAERGRLSRVLDSVKARGQSIAESDGLRKVKKAAGITGKAGVIWFAGSALGLAFAPVAALGYAAWNVKQLMQFSKK